MTVREPLMIEHEGKNVGAEWSSPVARQAHNLEVTGTNPVPATTTEHTPSRKPAPGRFFVPRVKAEGQSRSGLAFTRGEERGNGQQNAALSKRASLSRKCPEFVRLGDVEFA